MSLYRVCCAASGIVTASEAINVAIAKLNLSDFMTSSRSTLNLRLK